MGTFFNRLRGYKLGLPSGSQIKAHTRIRDLFDRLLAKPGFMAGRAEKPLYLVAKKALTNLDSTQKGRNILMHVFGEYAKDSMEMLGGINNVATALAGKVITYL